MPDEGERTIRDEGASTSLVDTLAATSAFGSLERRHLEAIAACANLVHWPAGQVVFREGEPDDRLYVVLEGLVSLDIYVPNVGRVAILTVGPNELLGWSAAVPGVEKKTASARTLQPTTAIAVDAQALHAACEADHDLGYQVYRTLARVVAGRLKATRLQLLDVYAVGGRS